ncbi:DUF5979 domain-containing protein [Microbacterium sp. C7(2022)]|uniref:DUF5979 domain-containing protein n=1 Tax=Microbacterium sp. C7(2022) TaxID=2992759 RepID=UPI00237C139A|nr:DUF5979 domain-containing protein [Microbacterium sp. C7(2022)]MDE0545049.1 DUF5979 domain-containing protein [Microbacterium sp. C7(2022)]
MARQHPRQLRRWLAALTAVTLAAASVLVGVAPAAFAADGDVQVTKTASVSEVVPGQTFSYSIVVSCTSITTGCNDAVLTDSVPGELIVNSVTIGAGLSGTSSVDGQDVEVDFDMPTASGGSGIPGGTTGIITISVTVRDPLPYELNGTTLTNTAVTDASTQTSGPLDSSADVTLVIPLDLDVDTSKTMDPASAVATPGLPVTATVSAQNTSNANVDTVTLTDPVDPTAADNPFDVLPFTGIGTVTYPDGAETAQVLVWDDTTQAWVPGPVVTAPDQPTAPASVDPADVKGVQVVFTSTDDPGIAAGSTGSAEIGMEQPDDVQELPTTTVTNTVDGTVDLDGNTDSDDASATHEIVAEDIDITASKEFDPNEVAAGDSSTATITATNDSDFALTDMTITEPALTDPDDPYAGGFDASMAFGGFTDGIDYPQGATGASITYYYDDGTSEGPLDFADGAEPPAPSGTVVRFEITFTGDIASGGSTEIPFDVDTDPDQAGYPATITNVATVDGTGPAGGNVSVDVDDDLLVYEKHLETIMDKSIYPSEILDRPGEWVLVTLSGQLAPFPGSTTDATEIVVQEPQTVPYDVDGTFWDKFDATEITNTAVPPNTTMTINYWNGSEWVPLLDENGDPVSVEGPVDNFTMELTPEQQEEIEGLQFVYTADDGSSLPPGTTVAPHFTAEIRDSERDTTTTFPDDPDGPTYAIENCGSSSASGEDGLQSTFAATAADCDEINLDPFDPDEGPDALDKDISPNTVVARSQDNVRAHLYWSTGGLSGVDQMVIQDESAPPVLTGDPDEDAAALAGSFYDAFDLISIDAITPEMDPHLQYDQIVAIEIWDGTSWGPIVNDPCPCDGSFPGVTLQNPERAAALAVRLVFEEGSGRVDATDPTAPPVGSGVSRSSGNDREVSLHFRLRDERRSDGSPVMGYQDYNIDDDDPTIGTVLDVANATGTDASGETVIDTDDADTIAILDVPLNVNLTKTWSNSPFGLPIEGTTQADYPTGRVTLDVQNLTATKVDHLRIEDPTPGAPETPFEYFDLLFFSTISTPSGADAAQTTVTLARDVDGDGVADSTSVLTRDEALTLGPAFLANVVGVTVDFYGRIDSDAHGVVVMDLRLRTETRSSTPIVLDSTTDPIPDPLTNYALATVEDAGGGVDGENVTEADASATVEFDQLNLEVAGEKVFTPDEQTEPDDSPVVMTLSVQPQGSARTGATRITDRDESFWNAFDYVGIDPSFVLTDPINRVRMDVLTGVTYTVVGDTIVATGGAWQNGQTLTEEEFLADPLPFGVTEDEIQGVRFSFTQLDDQGNPVQWENPTNPRQDVPVLVQRRGELRTGGEVPSDRADLAPAPDEAAPGEFTNDINVYACAILGPSCDQEDASSPNVVSAAASDTIYYRHLPSAVTIEKTPDAGEQVFPGAVIPYTISVTNTGEWPIENPVITDEPDAGVLMLDPDAGDAGPYAYALSGTPAGSTGLPMPVDPADVTVTVSGELYTFTFPEGTNLEVGETYTITIDMVTVPGVPANTVINNDAGVSGDRIFDECNGTGPATSTCETTTNVQVLSAGAARSGKLVRTVDDELGQFNSNTGEDCGPVTNPDLVPDGETFYTATCVPISKPGGEVVWRMAIANTGNIPMDRLMLVDRLPTPGDTGAISDIERGSQWSPIFIPGSIEFPDRQPTSWSYRVTTGDVCTDDLSVTEWDTCPAGEWVEAGDVQDAATITGVQTLIDLSGQPLMPGEILLMDARSITPAESETAGTNTIAWNTVATGAHVTLPQSTGSQDMVPVEGTKTGVALATGDLEVLKTTSGPGEDFAPDPLTVTLQCVSAVGTPVETELDPITLQLTPDVAQPVEDLPYGAECEIVEGDNGQISSSGTGGVVVGPDNPEGSPVGEATLDNYYDVAGLEISKSVESEAVDQDGTPIEYGLFTVAVTCTFVGEVVLADGYAVSPMIISLDADETVTLTGLPANATCMVGETDTDGAESTTTTGTNADGDVPATDDTSITIVLTPDADNAVTNAVEFDNVFGDGSLVLTKVVEPADSPFAEGPYLVQVDCVLDGESTWSDEIVLGPDPNDASVPATVQIDGIATGSECTVVETDDGNATTTTIETSPVTIVSDESVNVTITNTFAEGSATVKKDFAGDTSWADSAFDVTITCIDVTSGELFVVIPGGAVRTLDESNSYTTTYERLPAGAYCILNETDPGNSASSEIYDDATGEPVSFWQVQGDVERSFTVVNTFEVGSIDVTKESSGDGEGLWDDAEFTVSLSCTAEIDGIVTEIDIPGGPTRTVTVGETVTYEALPPGAECTVTEIDDGGASSSVITPNGGEIVVGGPDEPVLVTVDNTFDVGQLVVTKTLSGDAADWAVIGSFDIDLSCTWNGETIDILGGSARTLSAAGAFTTTYDDLPDGAECTVTETDDSGAAAVTLTPNDGTVTIEPGAEVDVTVDNRFDDGAIALHKTVVSDAVDAEGEPIGYGPFELSVDCTFLGAPVWGDGYTASPMVITIDADADAEITGLPAGSECTVSETDSDDAAGVVISGTTADGDITPSDETGVTFVVSPLDEGQTTVEIDVENTFDSGSLTLEKVIDPVDSPFASGPYTVAVSCALDGDVTWAGDVVFDAASDDPSTADDDTDFTATIENIATGSECSFEETDMGYADEYTIDPTTVVIGSGADEVVTVTVTNTYLEGSVTVQKVLEGDTYWAPDSFAITIDCTDPDFPERVIEIPGGADRTLDESNGYATTYSPLPVGAECELTETDDGYASSTVFEDANGQPVDTWTVTEDDDLQFTLVNTFVTDEIEVTKIASGDGAELWATDTFTVHLDCTWNGEPIEIPGGADRTLQITGDPATSTVVYEQLPPGAECEVTEPDTGGASSFTIEPNDGEDTAVGTVTVGDGDEPVAVTIDNTFDVGEIVVTKEITGDGADWVNGEEGIVAEFEVTLSCTWNGGEIEIPGGAVRTLSTDTAMSTTYEDLPDGAECVLEETDSASASEVTITPAGGEVVVEPGAEVTIDVENRYDVGGIDVRKVIIGAGGELGSNANFVVSLSCTWEIQGETVEIDIPGPLPFPALRLLNEANGYANSYEGLPNGAECVLSEVESGGATGVIIVTRDGTNALDGTVTVTENSSVEMVVINVFASGDLIIEKQVTGDGAEYFGQGPFTVHVTCTLEEDLLPRLTVYDEDVILGGDQPLEATITGIPTGSECTVTETDSARANEVTIEPASVVIGGPLADPVTVTVTNTFLIGQVTVEKVITGGGADEFGAGPFEVTLQCIDPETGDVWTNIPGGAVRTLDDSNEYSTTYEALPVGVWCGVAETDDGGADATRLLDADGNEIPQVDLTGESTDGYYEILDSTELMFTLENTFEPPLPATGLDARVIGFAGGLAAIMIAAGLVFVLRRREV